MPWTTEHLKTERLSLRPFVETDKPYVAELLTDEKVRRYLGGPVGADVLEHLRGATVGETWGRWCAVAADAPIYSCTLDRERGELEISFQLMPQFWGIGYGAEMVASVLAWVWDQTEDSAAIAVTQAANTPTRRLLDQLGFVYESDFEEFGEPQIQYRLMRR